MENKDKKQMVDDPASEVNVEDRTTHEQESEDQNELEALRAELEEAKDKYLRIFAEFDNYKKRTMRERLDTMKTASQDAIKALLPVVDDFDRAKKSADDESTEEYFTEGMTNIYTKLHNILKNMGLQAMETENVEFDPEMHEALTEIPAPDDSLKGKIIDTIEKGYQLNDKIIRHAKVVVGK